MAWGIGVGRPEGLHEVVTSDALSRWKNPNWPTEFRAGRCPSLQSHELRKVQTEKLMFPGDAVRKALLSFTPSP